MAILDTVISDGRYYSIQEEQFFIIASSDKTDEVDYKYVFDVYDQLTNQQLIRVKVLPQGAGKYGIYDISKVCKQTIGYGFQDNGDVVMYTNYKGTKQHGGTFRIEVGEEYGGTTYLNLTQRTTTAQNYLYGFNRLYDTTRYSGLSLLTDLSDLTKPYHYIKANLKDNILIPFYSQYELFTNAFITVTLIYKNGSYDTWIDDIGGSNMYMYSQLNIGADRINYYMAQRGSTLIIDENVKVYRVAVQVSDGSTNYNFQFIEVELTCSDNKYERTELIFYNRFGMYENITCNLVKRFTADIERKSFTKKKYALSGMTDPYVSNSAPYFICQDFDGLAQAMVESKINYASKSTYKYKLFYDVKSDEEYEWLFQLINSPQILMKNQNDYRHYVTITNTNYEFVKYQNDKFRPLEIDIEFYSDKTGFQR